MMTIGTEYYTIKDEDIVHNTRTNSINTGIYVDDYSISSETGGTRIYMNTSVTSGDKTSIYKIDPPSLNDGAIYKLSITLVYSKGSTSYGTVISTNRNAYPDNGTPDNTYWYEYVGIQS